MPSRVQGRARSSHAALRQGPPPLEHIVVAVAPNPMAMSSLTTGGRRRWSPRRAPTPPRLLLLFGRLVDVGADPPIGRAGGKRGAGGG
jgi:hypothetical protein